MVKWIMDAIDSFFEGWMAADEEARKKNIE